MRRHAALSIVALTLACGEGPFAPAAGPQSGNTPSSLEPSPAAPQPLAAAEKWEFSVVLTFVGTVEPGDTRITPSGVLHGTDLINEFQMTGDLEGSWFFIGKYHINLNDGVGRSIASPILVVVTSPGVGTFECEASAKLEYYPTADFIQHGNVRGCHGTGDYEGMSMRAYVTNEAAPGTDTYQMWGEMW